MNSAAASPSRPMVAALYVEKDGAYFGLPGVDPWDERRNALNYDGPYPVIAHPRDEFAALHVSVARQLAQARSEVARLEFELTQIAEARKAMVAE